MATINSYTGEVRSEPTTMDRTDSGWTLHVEDAVVDAVGLDGESAVVLRGSIGGGELTLAPADQDGTAEQTG